MYDYYFNETFRIKIDSPAEEPDHSIFDYTVRTYDKYQLESNNYPEKWYSGHDILIKMVQLTILTKW